MTNENNDFKDIEPFELTQDILKTSGGQIVQSRSSHQVAISVPKPRNIKKIEKEVLEEAQIAKDDFYWTWKVWSEKEKKYKWIEGGSIGLAQAMSRAWTNCAIETETKEELGKWIIRTHFIDFEKGFTTMREHRVTIPTKTFSKYDMDRTLDMKYQSGQSKNQRNTIFAALPRWLKNAAFEIAKQASKDDVNRNMPEQIKKAIEFFKDNDITEQELCIYFEKKSIEDFDIKDVVRLRNIASQLINKEVTVTDIKEQTKDIFDKRDKPVNKIKETEESKKERRKPKEKAQPEQEKESQFDMAKKSLNMRNITDTEIMAYFDVDDLDVLDCEEGFMDLQRIATDIEGDEDKVQEFKNEAMKRYQEREKSKLLEKYIFSLL